MTLTSLVATVAHSTRNQIKKIYLFESVNILGLKISKKIFLVT